MLALDPKTTALIMIDLQKGVVAAPTAPRPAAEVLANAKTLAERFRAAGAAVIWVLVAFAADFADAPRQNVDEPMRAPGPLPTGWSDLAEDLAAPGDIIVNKRHWGAFYGTELELQLRRRGVRTIALGGVATKFGVESRARQAWERGFDIVAVEDACAARSADMHDFAIRQIFPRLARLATRAELAFEPA
jgi:nicotinamidase-related amidase